MIEVVSKVAIRDKNGDEPETGKTEYITVTSHMFFLFFRNWVCLKLGTTTVTVEIDELEAAIKNAANCAR
jgi:hypothetical protein